MSNEQAVRAVIEGVADAFSRLDVDRFLQVPRVQVFLVGCVEAGRVGAAQPEGVAGDEGLAERDEFGWRMFSPLRSFSLL